MQIEEGKYYRQRDGQKIGPYRHNFDDLWIVGDDYLTARFDDGRFDKDKETDIDLIAEWVEGETVEDILARTSIPEAMQELQQKGVHDGNVGEAGWHRYGTLAFDPPSFDGTSPRKLTADDIEDHGTLPGPDDNYTSDLKAAAFDLFSGPADSDFSAYTALADVLNDAYMQAARGKGSKRHSAGKPFLEQPILEIVRMQTTIDGHAYQIMKKAQEAGRMLNRGRYNAAVAELYGVINYAAAAVIRAREMETEAGIPDSGMGYPVPVIE